MSRSRFSVRAKEVGHAAACSLLAGKRCDCAVAEAAELRKLLERVEHQLIFEDTLTTEDELFTIIRDVVRN